MASGEADILAETWYLVDCGDEYRFHRPTVSAVVAATAVRVVGHDPHQEPRDIPEVLIARGEYPGTIGKADVVPPIKLSEEGQLYCVERAIFWFALMGWNAAAE